MVSIPIPVERLTSDQTLHEILNAVLRIETALVPDTEALAEVERKIRANTEALAEVTSNPPEIILKERSMSDSPFDAVNAALAEQTAAIAALTAELATEHQQWLDAVAAGDTAQAEAIVAEVAANTAKLNQMTADLEASTPGAVTPAPAE